MIPYAQRMPLHEMTNKHSINKDEIICIFADHEPNEEQKVQRLLLWHR